MTKAKTTKLVRLDIVWQAQSWCIKQDGRLVGERQSTQLDAIRWARQESTWIIEKGARGVTVRIHRKGGNQLRDEFTLPRSADPRRSKG